MSRSGEISEFKHTTNYSPVLFMFSPVQSIDATESMVMRQKQQPEHQSWVRVGVDISSRPLPRYSQLPSIKPSAHLISSRGIFDICWAIVYGGPRWRSCSCRHSPRHSCSPLSSKTSQWKDHCLSLTHFWVRGGRVKNCSFVQERWWWYSWNNWDN